MLPSRLDRRFVGVVVCVLVGACAAAPEPADASAANTTDGATADRADVLNRADTVTDGAGAEGPDPDVPPDVPPEVPIEGSRDATDLTDLPDRADHSEAVDGAFDARADVADVALADGPPDAPTAEVGPDSGPEVTADMGPPPEPEHPPEARGPYPVGTHEYTWWDADRLRVVTGQVWYPAAAPGATTVVYLFLLPGTAYVDAAADPSGGPYPLVLFSHGFRGIHVQSFALTEHLASHGYVVAAPNHAGNTLFDFSATDADVAAASLERPRDLAFTRAQVAILATAGGDLAGMVDLERVAVAGHSFGGYSALVAAGAFVDVDEAKAQCAAGAPSDIFCDYMPYWADGSTIALDPALPGLRAGLYLAPGGYSAFGPAGLAAVTVPSAVFGGTLDTMTPLDVEIIPIYDDLPAPRMSVIIEGAGHMSFTNICGLPAAELYFTDFCTTDLIASDEAFAMTNTFATAFLGWTLKDDPAMRTRLDPAWATQHFPAVQLHNDAL